MRYLVKLVTPKGGCVLDPYLGSGTTAIGCLKEKFDYVGIELEQDYADIAEARLKATVVEFDIFDFIEEE
jgi:site-specific DNA-methyltransferase (adenine-specific)